MWLITKEKTLKQIKQFQTLKKVNNIKPGPNKNYILFKVFNNIYKFRI